MVIFSEVLLLLKIIFAILFFVLFCVWFAFFKSDIENCSSHVCEELCCKFNRSCIKFVDCFCRMVMFYYFNPTNPWACESSPFPDVLFDFFIERLEVLFPYRSFTCFIRVPQPHIISDNYEAYCILIFFLSMFNLCIKKGYWFAWVNLISNNFEVIRCRSSLIEFWDCFCVLSHHQQIVYLDFLFAKLYLFDLFLLSPCSCENFQYYIVLSLILVGLLQIFHLTLAVGMLNIALIMFRYRSWVLVLSNTFNMKGWPIVSSIFSTLMRWSHGGFLSLII